MSLKPLKWKNTGNDAIKKLEAQGAGIYYTITTAGKGVTVVWADDTGGSDDSKHFKTIDEAQEWVDTEHYPHKMARFVSQDSIGDIVAWFKAAKPEPTINDICTQIGCHYEEVSEMAKSLCRPRETDFSMVVDHTADFYKKARLDDNHDFYDVIPDPLETLDALCDQIVTAVGVGYMMGFDMIGALREVVRSNNSKMVNGRFEFDENGKIMKAASFSKPNLEPYLNKE